jgi:hypothetical protein
VARITVVMRQIPLVRIVAALTLTVAVFVAFVLPLHTTCVTPVTGAADAPVMTPAPGDCVDHSLQVFVLLVALLVWVSLIPPLIRARRQRALLDSN